MKDAWILYAQRRRKAEITMLGGNSFYRFGPEHWASGAVGEGVSEVELSLDSRGTYWAWLPSTVNYLTHVHDSEAAVKHGYSGGDNTENMYEAEREGRGRLVRLSLRELSKVS